MRWLLTKVPLRLLRSASDQPFPSVQRSSACLREASASWTGMSMPSSRPKT